MYKHLNFSLEKRKDCQASGMKAWNLRGKGNVWVWQTEIQTLAHLYIIVKLQKIASSDS